ncbi:MAG: hypothetical protein ACPGVL_18060 [Pseudoalteromonas spongiae]|jgi:hypothetical protein
MNIVKVIALLCVISLLNVSTAKAVQYDTMPSVSSVVCDFDNSNLNDLDDGIISKVPTSVATTELFEFLYNDIHSSFSTHHSVIRAPPLLN